MAPSSVDIAIRKCFESAKYSDLLVQSGSREFKVHKNVVCGQSEWFEKAIKKDAFLEGETGVVKMDDDDPDAVAAMLSYLYTGRYTMSSAAGKTLGDDADIILNKSWPPAMMFNLQVYELADRLRIHGLQDLAEQKLRTVVEKQWDLPEFAEAVKYAYSIAPPGSTGDELRTIIAEISADHARQLFSKEHEAFADMMDEMAEFGKDLSKELASRLYSGEVEAKSKDVFDSDESDDDMGFGLFD